ncbi:MAG: PAS domain S-box protein [Planctomycetota bacterium]
MADRNNPGVQNAAFSAILESAVDAIITIDRHGIIASANPATTVLFGYAVDDLVGQNVKILMPSPYHEEHDGYLHNYLDTNIKKIIGIGREVVGRRRDGTLFPMHLAVSEFKNGGDVMFAGIVRDITDLKQVEQRLEELNAELEDRVRTRTDELHEAQAELIRNEKFAMLGKVSGGIAHEIRNPLNAVKTSAYYLLNASNPTEEKKREHLERINRQVELIDNVITALSDVARMPDARLEMMDVIPVLRSVVGTIDLPAEIEVVDQLGVEPAQALMDRNQLAIAFKNILRNARDAMPEGGSITIGCTVSGECVSFHFEDSGTGIPAGILERIFDPLFTTKARGMGLGLSITRTIVEKNGGHLTVESQPGEGSRFTIKLTRTSGDTS